MSIDVDVQDYTNGWTAFMHAVHNKHHLVAQLLAKYNANVTLKARNGSSAFDIANLIGKRDRDRERQRHRERQRDRDRETKRQRDRDRDRDRER